MYNQGYISFTKGELEVFILKKEITHTIYVRIKGNYVLLDSLQSQERTSVLVELNDRAMKAAGFVRTEDKTA